jgi:hypothetical protein
MVKPLKAEQADEVATVSATEQNPEIVTNTDEEVAK